MNTKPKKTRNFVAKHAAQYTRGVVHENRKRKAELALGKYKKGPLWDLI